MTFLQQMNNSLQIKGIGCEYAGALDKLRSIHDRLIGQVEVGLITEKEALNSFAKV